MLANHVAYFSLFALSGPVSGGAESRKEEVDGRSRLLQDAKVVRDNSYTSSTCPRHCRFMRIRSNVLTFGGLRHRSSSAILLLLLLCGDVEVNPGPSNERKVAATRKVTCDKRRQGGGSLHSAGIAGTECICSLCDKPIQEKSANSEGVDALQCDGPCQSWMHRCCACVPLKLFTALANSDDTFVCPMCSQQEMMKTIRELKDSVCALQLEVASLKHSQASSSQHATHAHTSAVSASPDPPTSSQSHPVHQPSESDREYNVVIFGITELPKGSSRYSRSEHDFNQASSVISNLQHKSDYRCSIRNCRRLGKYDVSKFLPRPLLVSLNSTADVRFILAHCHCLPPSIFIKPDRSVSERKTEKLLLEERWKLIQSGKPRSSIKLRNSALYLNGRLHGKVSNHTFNRAPLLSDLAPQIVSRPVNTSSQSPADDNASVNTTSTSLPSASIPTTSLPTTSVPATSLPPTSVPPSSSVPPLSV